MAYSRCRPHPITQPPHNRSLTRLCPVCEKQSLGSITWGLSSPPSYLPIPCTVYIYEYLYLGPLLTPFLPTYTLYSIYILYMSTYTLGLSSPPSYLYLNPVHMYIYMSTYTWGLSSPPSYLPIPCTEYI